MAVNTNAVGKSYPPRDLRRRAREDQRVRRSRWARPTRCTSTSRRRAPLGYADVVAPPMFAVVYSSPAIGPALFDPEIGINFALMVHGGQEFKWGPLVVAGDEIDHRRSTVKDISERGGIGFYVFETVSTNQDGDTVCVGTWTNIVRGG